MKTLIYFLCSTLLSLQAGEASWKSHVLETNFYAEGSSVGDIDRDGHVDIVYGPHWYKGPSFSEKFKFYDGKIYQAKKGYSNHFFSFLEDVDQDNDLDILVFGFPGKDVKLYLNPGEGYDKNWEVSVTAKELGHESPTYVDLIPGGLKEIVGSKGKSYGYYQANENPREAWEWVPISKEGMAQGKFGHGLGVVDINGDGRLDLVDRMRVFEQPNQAKGEWKMKPWVAKLYGRGGAQILGDDVDGDGDVDLITSKNAHGYGLSWFETDRGDLRKEHLIMSDKVENSPCGMAFSQLHAMAAADIDGDGDRDFVTGKRYMAHQGKDPGGLDAPVLVWFEKRGKGSEVKYVPHTIHEDSGVGVGVVVADLNGDQKLDVVSANKKGLTIHLQVTAKNVRQR